MQAPLQYNAQVTLRELLVANRARWYILALLFLITTNNYLDRIVLGIVIPSIMKDLRFNELEYGYVVSTFQFSYAIGFLLMGRFIDRFGVRLGYVVSIGWWSVSAALHSTVRSPAQLGFWRGMLGLGESGNFPAAIKAVSEWFPKRERAFATGIFNAGSNVATMIGPPVFVWIAARYGWRTCFVVTPVIGTVSLTLWWLLYRSPARHRWVTPEELALIQSDSDEQQDEPPMKWVRVIRIRKTWGCILAKFFSDPVWWFYLTWLALYFKNARGLSLKEIGWALPCIYLMADFGSVFGGWLSGWLIGRGWAPARARKACMFGFALCMPVAATAVLMPKTWMAVALISLATSAHQAWSANLYTLTSDLFPKTAVASVTGIGGFMGGMGGVLFTALLPGYLVTHFGYGPVFVIMGSGHLVGFACAHFLLGRLERVRA